MKKLILLLGVILLLSCSKEEGIVYYDVEIMDPIVTELDTSLRTDLEYKMPEMNKVQFTDDALKNE